MILKKRKIARFIYTLWLFLLMVINPVAIPLAYAQAVEESSVPAIEEEVLEEESLAEEETKPALTETSSQGSTEEALEEEEAPVEAAEEIPQEEIIETIEPSCQVDCVDQVNCCPEEQPAEELADQCQDCPVDQQPIDDFEQEEIVDDQTEEETVPGGSAIDTGDANSLAGVSNTVNENEDIVPGEMIEGGDICTPPVGETECLDGAEVFNNNFADVDAQATSSANTGENDITGSEGDADIDTGDATAGADVGNQVNTNTTVFEETEDPPEPVEEEVFGQEGESDPTVVLVDNENEGFIINDLEVEAGTGENSADENQGDTAITTGDALAYANLINFLNTNLVGSDFGLYLLNLTEGHQGDINLDQWWQEIVEKTENEGLAVLGEEDFDLFRVINNNYGEITNNVDVNANTGENTAAGNAGQTGTETGDATALANVINFANINLAGSNFFLPVINIFGSFTGDILLPRPEKFMSEYGLSGSFPMPLFLNQNSADVVSDANTSATTGGNLTSGIGGGSAINTGEAESHTNVSSMVNSNFYGNDWFFLSINALGSLLGNIWGWSSPDSVEEFTSGPMTFEVQNTGSPEEGFPNPEENNHQEPVTSVIANDNQAVVNNDVNVSANTGDNQITDNPGDAEIGTGKATALTNLLNFVNLNVWGSNWFFGLINILGDWSGNIVFAYPDMTLSLSNQAQEVEAGSATEYLINYQNKGNDLAGEVVVDLELPRGVHYLSDNSGFPVEVNGQHCRWYLGQVEVGQEGFFAVTIGIDTDLSATEELSFWSKLFAVHAAEHVDEFRIVLSASIGTDDPESDLSNNQSFAITDVYKTFETEPEAAEEVSEEGGGVDQRQPVLEVTAWNNVNGFVYPGDTVRFEITIKNNSDAPSYDTLITHALYNGLPDDFGVAGFNLGTLNPGERAVLRFGMYLVNDGSLHPSSYRTVTQAFGYATNDSEVASNEALTYFEIKAKGLIPVFKVEAREDDGAVLGDSYCGSETDDDVLPFLLIFLISSLGLIEKTRRLLAFKKEH